TTLVLVFSHALTTPSLIDFHAVEMPSITLPTTLLIPSPSVLKNSFILTEKLSEALLASSEAFEADSAASAANLACLSEAVSVPDVSHVSKLDLKPVFSASVLANVVLSKVTSPNVKAV